MSHAEQNIVGDLIGAAIVAVGAEQSNRRTEMNTWSQYVRDLVEDMELELRAQLSEPRIQFLIHDRDDSRIDVYTEWFDEFEPDAGPEPIDYAFGIELSDGVPHVLGLRGSFGTFSDYSELIAGVAPLVNGIVAAVLDRIAEDAEI